MKLSVYPTVESISPVPNLRQALCPPHREYTIPPPCTNACISTILSAKHYNHPPHTLLPSLGNLVAIQRISRISKFKTEITTQASISTKC